MTTHISQSLRPIIDNAALSLFGLTLSQAHIQRICIRCKTPAMNLLLSRQHLQDYKQSGLCPECHTNLTTPKEGNN